MLLSPQMSAQLRSIFPRVLAPGFLVTENSPVQDSTQSTGKQGNWKARRKTEQDDAETRAAHSRQKNRLPADLVAQSSPQEARQKLSQGERRRHPTGVHGDFAFVIGDVEVLDHVVDVGENRHEGDGLAYPA